MDERRRMQRHWSGLVIVLACTGTAFGQPAALGPTSAAVQPAPVTWPVRPPARIYVLPFAMEPGLQEQLQQQVSVLPQGPARNMIGFGVGNASIGIDVALADPATAGGQPFFILDSSDKGRRMPGTLSTAAVAGFNPAVIAGKLVASNSGIADIAQQQRMADEIARSVAEGVRARWPR